MLSPILTVLMRIDSNYTFEMPRACLSCADVGFLVILHQSRYWTALPEIAWTFSKYLRFDSASKAVSVYRSQREERERDILCLDKPWSVRIVSIACHPSIHLSILETLYTTCPFQELILSSVYLPTTPLPIFSDVMRLQNVRSVCNIRRGVVHNLRTRACFSGLHAATASFLYSSPSKASDICSFWHKSRLD